MPNYQQTRNTPPEVKLRFLPDSPEFIRRCAANCGYHARLEKVVREAIARANRQ